MEYKQGQTVMTQDQLKTLQQRLSDLRRYL